MTSQELSEIIADLLETAGDTAHVEAKSAQGGLPKRLWETLSAFANTPGGGVILLGWNEETRKVCGVREPRKIQQDLASVCDQMVPPLRPLIEPHVVEGKTVVTAEIPEASFKEKPCYYKGSGMVSGAYIRVADGDRQLTQYEVQGYLDGRGQPSYDIESVPGTSVGDLSQTRLRAYLMEIRQKFSRMAEWDDDKILLATRILVQSDEKTCLSLGGLLTLGGNPQQFLPGLSAHVLVYPRDKEGLTGPKDERLLDNIKIEGPIPSMVPEIIAAIKRNLSKQVHIKGLFREDVLEYPDIFLREAVANALIHRDYSPLSRGTAVQIKIFPDRIEIQNPGGLFGPVTEDRLGEHGMQAARNAFLIKILEDCPVPGTNGALCENRGTGILHMIQSLRKAGMEPPSFRDQRTSFRVICFNTTLFDAQTIKWFATLAGNDLSERQRYSLAFVRHRGVLGNLDYCRINDCDSRLATRELTDLVRLGLLKQEGSRRWTRYTLPPIPAPAQRKSPKGDRRKIIIDFIAAGKEVARNDIQRGLHMPAVTVLYWLRRLIHENTIERTTSAQSRNARYRLAKTA